MISHRALRFTCRHRDVEVRLWRPSRRYTAGWAVGLSLQYEGHASEREWKLTAGLLQVTVEILDP